MTDSRPPIPSPMTPARLRLMQARAAKGQPLTQPGDNAGVTASLRNRSTSLAGHAVLARAVGHKRKLQTSKLAKFDDDGDEIEIPDEFAAVDRYLATKPGSAAALAALAAWRAKNFPKFSK